MHNEAGDPDKGKSKSIVCGGKVAMKNEERIDKHK
jgi:hypothetical protein